MSTSLGKTISGGICVLIGLALLCGLARPALGQAPESITVTTSFGPLAREAGYQLRIQSGAGGASFGFQYDLPVWPTTEPVVGSPLWTRAVELSGPGSIRPASIEPVPKPMLPRNNACLRNRPSSISNRIWVEIPSNSTAVVDLRFRGTYPVWPGTKNQIAFSTFDVNSRLAPLTPLTEVHTTPLMPKGTHIELRAKGKHHTVRSTPELVGRTLPPLRKARIALRAVRPARSGKVKLEAWSSPAAIPLGSVRTDRRGHFRVAPQPFNARGSFAVLARSEARGSRAADWNCGAFFAVK